MKPCEAALGLVYEALCSFPHVKKAKNYAIGWHSIKFDFMLKNKNEC
jgi:hypothetical protein